MSAKIIKLRQVDGIVYASSLDVANDFGKEHKDVIKAIDKIGATLRQSFWFKEDFWFDRYGRQQRCILMSRQGWTLIVMRFTGQEALDWQVAYIEKFDEMEAKLGAGARTEALFHRTKRDNVVAFPPDPQGQLWFAAAPEPELPIVDPVREEAELEAELRRYNAEFPKCLVAINEKQRRAFEEAWRCWHLLHDLPPGDERNQNQPQVCYGPGGILVERYDV